MRVTYLIPILKLNYRELNYLIFADMKIRAEISLICSLAVSLIEYIYIYKFDRSVNPI